MHPAESGMRVRLNMGDLKRLTDALYEEARRLLKNSGDGQGPLKPEDVFADVLPLIGEDQRARVLTHVAKYILPPTRNRGPVAVAPDRATDEQVVRDIVRTFGDMEWVDDLISSVVAHRRSPDPSDLVLGGLLMAAVSAFEGHAIDLTEEYLKHQPQAANDIRLRTSLEKLTTMSPDQLLAWTASEVAEATHRGSVRERLQYLKPFLQSLPPDHEWELQEVLLRRNALVHVGRRSSRAYEQHLLHRPHGVSQPGHLDAGYVMHAIDTVHVTICVLATEAWASWETGPSPASVCTGMALYAIAKERWEAADKLTSFLLAREQDSVSRVNRWLYLSRRFGGQSIHCEVAHWEPEESDPVLQLVRLCLLSHWPAAIAAARELAVGGNLSQVEFFTWPVLRGLREQASWSDLVKAQPGEKWVSCPA